MSDVERRYAMDSDHTTPFRIIVITGASATGKSTLTIGLLNKLRNARVLTSVTTRQPRDDDLENEYEYVSQTDFEYALAQDEFFSYAKVFENYYGMRKSILLDALNDYSKDVFIRPLTPDKITLWRAYDKKNIAFLHLVPPPPFEIRARLAIRGTPANEITARLQKAKEWENQIVHLVADGVPIRFVTGGTPAIMLVNALQILRVS